MRERKPFSGSLCPLWALDSPKQAEGSHRLSPPLAFRQRHTAQERDKSGVRGVGVGGVCYLAHTLAARRFFTHGNPGPLGAGSSPVAPGLFGQRL